MWTFQAKKQENTAHNQEKSHTGGTDSEVTETVEFEGKGYQNSYYKYILYVH